MKKANQIIRTVLFGLFLTFFAGGLEAQTIGVARQLVKNNDINGALREYTSLVDQAIDGRKQTRSVDPTLLAEYGYTLALAHVYDVALANLDEALCTARALHKRKTVKEVNFYISEVLLLMKYDSLAEPFQRQCQHPSWFSQSEIDRLRENYRAAPIINREDFKTTMARIHKLTKEQGFVQALVLSEEMSFFYKPQYFSDLESGDVWGKLGFPDKAILSYQTAKNKSCDASDTMICEFADYKVQYWQKRINSPFQRWVVKYTPGTLLYLGGAFSLSTISINSRIGFYTNTQFNVSLNLSYSYFLEIGNNTFTVGLSAYQRFFNMLAVGASINNQFSNGDYNLYVAPLVGLSFYRPMKKMSIDLFYNMNIPCLTGGNLQHNITFGITTYL